MKIAQDLTKLLDKLYNLKGEDNVIIAEINNDIRNVEDRIVEEADKQSKNELAKVETESQLSIFVTQKEAFCSTFTGIDNDTFKALNAIGVNLDISGMLKLIDEKAPFYCNELTEKIKVATQEIEKAKEARENLNDDLDKLNKKLETAKGDRQQLIGLLEQSLSPNVLERESLTAKYAKDIINKFGVFSSSESSALAKVILFPEDGLIEFDETYDEREHEHFEPAKENNENVERVKDEVILKFENKEKAETTEQNNTFETYKNEVKVEEPTEEVAEEVSEESNVEATNDEEDNEKTSELDLSQMVEDDDVTSQETDDFDNEPTRAFDLSSLNLNNDEDTPENTVIEDINNIEEINPLGDNDASSETIMLTSDNKDDSLNEEAEETEEVKEVEDTQEETEPEVTEEVEEDKYAELKENLENSGISLDKLSNNDCDLDTILEKLNGVDFKHVEENYEILRSLNVSDDITYKYNDGYMYLTDQDLNKKVTLFRAKGISENKIKELISDSESGFKEDYPVIEKRITVIENTNDKLNDDNVYLLSKNMDRYNDNLEILNNNGYEIDDKDLRNYQAVLFNSQNVKEDVEVLKNYLLSIQRKNGKYALGVFFKDAKDLLFDIDDVIEANLEEMLLAHPEILANRVDSLLARVKYASSNGDSIYENEENGVFNKNIIDGLKFHRTYNHDVNEYMPRKREEVNSSITSLVDNTKEVVDTLNNYYENTTLFNEIKLTDSEKKLYNDLRNLLKENLEVVSNGTHTYLINGIAVSKNKVERNLEVLVKDKNSVDGMEKALILGAILYNLRESEEVIKQIIDSYGKKSDSSKNGGEE